MYEFTCALEIPTFFLCSFWRTSHPSIVLIFTYLGSLLQVEDGLGWGRIAVLQELVVMEETKPLKREKTHVALWYTIQFTNLLYVLVHHPKNCQVDVREDLKGFSMGRRSLREQNTLSEVVNHL